MLLKGVDWLVMSLPLSSLVIEEEAFDIDEAVKNEKCVADVDDLVTESLSEGRTVVKLSVS